MDFKKLESRLDDACSFLTRLGQFLWKHFFLLLFLGVAYFVYWSITSDFEEVQETQQKIGQIAVPRQIEQNNSKR